MSQDYLDKLIEKDKAGTQIQSIPLHDTELRGITIDDPITVEGNPINFSTKNEQNAIQTVIDLDPIEDLHGYSKPWVGGAGKNKFKLDLTTIKEANPNGTWTDNVFVKRGVTFTINTDSDGNIISVKMNGTAEAGAFCDFNFIESTRKTLDNFGLSIGSTYIFTNGYTSDNANVSLQYNGSINNIVASKNGTTFTVNNSDTYFPQIRIAANTVVSNLYAYPMVRLSSVTDATFEPYENICPILPHEEIKIEGCGKNLFNSKILMNGTQYLLCEEFKVKPGTYNFIFTNNSSNMMAFWARSGYDITDDTTKFVNAGKTVQTTYEVTGEGIIAFGFRHNPIDSTVQITDVKDAMFLVSNETDLTYEPYKQSNSLTIPLPEDIYGGTLNLETGELVVDWKYISNLGSLYWNYSSGYGGIFYAAINDAKYSGDGKLIGYDCYCSQYTSAGDKTWNHFDNGDINVGSDTSGGHKPHVNIKDNRYSDAATFKNAMLDVQLVYPLATPYTLQLTPAQLKLFKDVNNLNSSDYTTLTVTYHSNSMATLTPATDMTDGLLSAMDKHKLNTYNIADIGSDDGVTVEDNPLMITTRSDQHALSTKVSLAPIQDLHGFTKPWVGGAGKNLLKMTVQGIKAAYKPISGTWSGNTFTSDNLKFILITDSDDNIIAIKYEITGTLSEQKYIYLDTFSGLSGNYLLSGGVSQNIYVTLMINNSWSGKYSRDPLSDTELTISSSSDTIVAAISVGANISGSGYFYPMIRLATEPNPTFEPYTNICSISGLDEIDILGCGKNIFDGTYQAAYVEGASIIYKYNADCRTAVVPIIGGKTYSVTRTGGNRFSIAEAWEFPVFNNAYIFLYAGPNEVSTKMTATVKTSKDTKYLLIYVSNAAVNAEVQVEESKEVTDYEPYKQSNNLSLPLPETVYGGELDLESGELRVIEARYKISDFSWDYYSPRFEALGINYKGGTVRTVSILSSAYGCISDGRPSGEVPQYCIYGNEQRIFIHDARYNNVTNFVSAMGNETICYPLATPTTIHLTPEQLTLFKDINHISTNAKSISVTYREGKLAINSPATDTKDGLLSAIDKRALDRTEEIVEGNPIAFETESAQVAKSTIVDLEPIQDLHGYSKPWVGGAGKNKLPSSQSKTETVDGLTFKTLDDGQYNIKGTTASQKVSSTEFTLENDFTFPSNSSYSLILRQTQLKSLSFKFYDTNDVLIDYWTLTDSERTISNFSSMVGKTCHSIIIVVGDSPSNVNDIVSISMIANSETDKSYTPWKNICPITGRTEIGILGYGKNLFDNSTLEQGDINNQTGEDELDGSANHVRSGEIYVEPNTTYTFSYNHTISGSGTFKVLAYEPDGTFISRVNSASTSKTYTFTTLANYGIIRLGIYDSAGVSVSGLNMQFEKGSSATDFEPYTKSNDLTISFGQTVYGGTLDVENGVLVVNKAIADLGDFTYTKQDAGTSSAKIFYTNFDVISNIKYYGIDEMPNSTCSCFVNDTAIRVSNGALETINQGYTSSHRLRICSLVYASLNETEFKTVVTGQKLCYELATPTTISLTPEQVKLLQGVNTITTNADNITLTYRNGSVATLNDLESLYAKLKAYIDSLHSS